MRSRDEFVQRAAAVRHDGLEFRDDLHNLSIDKSAIERQGMRAAMRSVSVTTWVQGFLGTSDGRRISLQEIDP